jgi:hypothetical protein
LSYAGERRTGPVPAARTPALPVRHPATPSHAHDHIDPAAGSWFSLVLFNPREQHAGPRVIGRQSVRLSASSARPARRPADGRTILDARPAAQEPGPDPRFRGALLRNRTVDLLLTMNHRQVPLPQVVSADQENTSSRQRSQVPIRLSRAPFATQSATHFDLDSTGPPGTGLATPSIKSRRPCDTTADWPQPLGTGRMASTFAAAPTRGYRPLSPNASPTAAIPAASAKAKLKITSSAPASM